MVSSLDLNLTLRSPADLWLDRVPQPVPVSLPIDLTIRELPHPSTLEPIWDEAEREIVFKRLFPLSPASDELPEILIHSWPAGSLSQKERSARKRLSPLDVHCWGVHPAGKLLARWILDHPTEFEGKKVVDIGSGSGVVAIACAKVGATVTAIELSRMSCEVIKENAKANNVQGSVTAALGSGLFIDLGHADIVTTTETFHRGNSSNNALVATLVAAMQQRTVFVGSYLDPIPGSLLLGEALIVNGPYTLGSHYGIRRLGPAVTLG